MNSTLSTSDLLKAHSDSMVSLLEEILSGDSQCESTHAPNSWGDNDAGCSIQVTHRMNEVCKGHVILVCQNRVDYYVQTPNLFHVCKKPVSECVTFIPV